MSDVFAALDKNAATVTISVDDAYILFRSAITGVVANGTEEDRLVIVGIIMKFAAAIGIPLPEGILPTSGTTFRQILSDLHVATEAMVQQVDDLGENSEGFVRRRFEEIASDFRRVRDRLASMVSSFAGDVKSLS